MTLDRRWTKGNALRNTTTGPSVSPRRSPTVPQATAPAFPAVLFSEPILQHVLCGIHELKGSMSTIELAIAGVSEEALGVRDRRRLDISREQLCHMYEALDGIIVAIRDGIPTGNRETLDLNALLEDCIRGIEVLADHFSIEVSRLYCNRPLAIHADREQLRMCFNNILRNAVDAVGSGGALTIATAVAGDDQTEWAAIMFKDTGPGLSLDPARKAFAPCLSAKRRGLGLGLFLSKRVLSEHEGSIEIVSEPGPGTSVLVRLPLNRGPRCWTRS